MNNTIWTWEWKSGGYNSCTAPSREEALAKALAMGQPHPTAAASGGMTVTLLPDPKTLRSVTPEEMSAIDRRWACAFD